jgi:hypothetical protein
MWYYDKIIKNGLIVRFIWLFSLYHLFQPQGFRVETYAFHEDSYKLRTSQNFVFEGMSKWQERIWCTVNKQNIHESETWLFATQSACSAHLSFQRVSLRHIVTKLVKLKWTKQHYHSNIYISRNIYIHMGYFMLRNFWEFVTGIYLFGTF